MVDKPMVFHYNVIWDLLENAICDGAEQSHLGCSK